MLSHQIQSGSILQTFSVHVAALYLLISLPSPLSLFNASSISVLEKWTSPRYYACCFCHLAGWIYVVIIFFRILRLSWTTMHIVSPTTAFMGQPFFLLVGISALGCSTWSHSTLPVLTKKSLMFTYLIVLLIPLVTGVTWQREWSTMKCAGILAMQSAAKSQWMVRP